MRAFNIEKSKESASWHLKVKNIAEFCSSRLQKQMCLRLLKSSTFKCRSPSTQIKNIYIYFQLSHFSDFYHLVTNYLLYNFIEPLGYKAVLGVPDLCFFLLLNWSQCSPFQVGITLNIFLACHTFNAPLGIFLQNMRRSHFMQGCSFVLLKMPFFPLAF